MGSSQQGDYEVQHSGVVNLHTGSAALEAVFPYPVELVEYGVIVANTAITGGALTLTCTLRPTPNSASAAVAGGAVTTAADVAAGTCVRAMRVKGTTASMRPRLDAGGSIHVVSNNGPTAGNGAIYVRVRPLPNSGADYYAQVTAGTVLELTST